MKTQVPETATRLNVMTGIAALACLLSIVGTLLPWIDVTAPFDEQVTVEVNLVGTDSRDGKLVFGLAFAALAAVVASRFYRRVWLGVVAFLVGSAIAATGIADIANVETDITSDIARELFPILHISPGPGLYVVVLGGVALAAAAAYLAFTARVSGTDSSEKLRGTPGDD